MMEQSISLRLDRAKQQYKNLLDHAQTLIDGPKSPYTSPFKQYYENDSFYANNVIVDSIVSSNIDLQQRDKHSVSPRSSPNSTGHRSSLKVKSGRTKGVPQSSSSSSKPVVMPQQQPSATATASYVRNDTATSYYDESCIAAPLIVEDMKAKDNLIYSLKAEVEVLRANHAESRAESRFLKERLHGILHQGANVFLNNENIRLQEEVARMKLELGYERQQLAKALRCTERLRCRNTEIGVLKKKELQSIFSTANINESFHRIAVAGNTAVK